MKTTEAQRIRDDIARIIQTKPKRIASAAVLAYLDGLVAEVALTEARRRIVEVTR